VLRLLGLAVTAEKPAVDHSRHRCPGCFRAGAHVDWYS